MAAEPTARHYLDHASSVPLRDEAAQAMVQWATSAQQADPGRPYGEGRATRALIEEARDVVAAFLGARPRELVFTSSGTEAANWASRGARALGDATAPMLLSGVEHSSVRRSAQGSGPVETIGVDGLGRLDLEHLRALLSAPASPRPCLVHCQQANHEVGTVQPLEEVAALCAEHGVALHVDACASFGHLPLDCAELGAALVSVSAHKLGGPPGVGALVVARGTRLSPLLVGAEQERARRAGTENVPGIVAFAAALEALGDNGLAVEAGRARAQSEALLHAALSVPDVVAYGDVEWRLPHLVCVGVNGVEAEGVVLGLDQVGIAVHSGSACASEGFEPSPVLEAMGVDAQRSLRLSVGWSTTEDDVAAFASAFPAVVSSLRALAL